MSERISQIIKDFRTDRPIIEKHNNEGHVLALLVGEFNELMDAYEGDVEPHEIDEEIADVIIYCMTLLQLRGQDIDQTILSKLALNHSQHPAGNYQTGNYREQYIKSKTEAKQIRLKEWWYERDSE